MARLKNRLHDIAPNAEKTYGIDYRDFLERSNPLGGNLSSSTWDSLDGALILAESMSATGVTVKLTVPDGIPGTSHRVKNHVTNQSGDDDYSTVILTIEDQ